VETTQVAPVDAFASVVQLIFSIGSWIVWSLSAHVIGKKLRHGSPWLAWVPIVNIFYLLSLAGRPAWQFLLLCIPIVNIFVYGAMFGNISERLQMPAWLGWCMLLPVANIFIIAYMAASGQGPRPERRRRQQLSSFERAGARTT
jgi:hypothetical protein